MYIYLPLSLYHIATKLFTTCGLRSVKFVIVIFRIEDLVKSTVLIIY